MTDTNTPEASPSGPGLAANKFNRKLVVALIASLAVNLLFIGALAGRLANGPPPRTMTRHLSWMVRDLDPQVRKQLRPQMQAHADKTRPLRRSLRETQRNIQSILVADPLDEASLIAALNDLQTTSSTLQISMHEEMVELAKQLGPDQRSHIARFLSRPERGERHKPDADESQHD